jgi:hypothetical protein
MSRQSAPTDSPHALIGRTTDVPGDAIISPSAPAADRSGRITLPTKLLIPASVVFLLSLPVFARLVFTDSGKHGDTDYQLHVALALDMARGKAMVPHPLFHALLLALMGGDNADAAPGMMAFILAAALGARAYLTAGMLASSRRLSAVALTVLCLALAVVMPLPNWWDWPNVCRGLVAANAWYNPTGVFAMPFALALFLVGLRELEDDGWGSSVAVAVAMVLSLLAKPNYVIAFAPCFAVMLAMKYYRSIKEGRLTSASAAGKAALIFGPTAGVLAVQYLILYGGPNATGGPLVYLPLQLWRVFTRDHIPAAVYLGVAFPIAVTVLFPLAANADRALVLAWSVLALGILQVALFQEWGSRQIHFNLSWGMILGAHLLFVVSCAFLLRQPGGVRRWVAFAVLALQVASGCMCLVRSLIEPWKSIQF